MSAGTFSPELLDGSLNAFSDALSVPPAKLVPHLSFEDDTDDSTALLKYVSEDSGDSIGNMSRVILNYILAGVPMTGENMASTQQDTGELMSHLLKITAEKSGYLNPCLEEADKQRGFPGAINRMTDTIITAFTSLRQKFKKQRTSIETKRTEHQIMRNRPPVAALQNIPAPLTFGITSAPVTAPPIRYAQYDIGAQTSSMASAGQGQSGYQTFAPQQQSDKKSTFVSLMSDLAARR